jgi:hypothetical protein
MGYQKYWPRKRADPLINEYEERKPEFKTTLDGHFTNIGMFDRQ